MFNLKFKRIQTRDLHVISLHNLILLLLYDGFTMATQLSMTDFEAFQSKSVHMSTFRNELIGGVK